MPALHHLDDETPSLPKNGAHYPSTKKRMANIV